MLNRQLVYKHLGGIPICFDRAAIDTFRWRLGILHVGYSGLICQKTVLYLNLRLRIQGRILGGSFYSKRNP